MNSNALAHTWYWTTECWQPQQDLCVILPGAPPVLSSSFYTHNFTMASPSTVYGVSPAILRFCPQCFPDLSLGSPSHPPGQHDTYPWAVALVCRQCTCLFSLCTLCPDQRSRLLNKSLRRRHHQRYHLPRVANPPPPPTHVTDSPRSTVSALNTETSSIQTYNIENQFQYQDHSNQVVIFSTKQSTLYFQHQANNGSGPHYLASRSIFHLDHTYTALTTDDVSLNLLLGHLVILLPDKPRKMLCYLIKTILGRTSAPPLNFFPLPPGILIKPQFHISSLPSNYPELRRQFIEGSNAMFSSLPTPKIYSFGNHAYCLPSDCLQHHLSYGYPAAFFTSDPPPPIVSHIKHSPRGLQVPIGKTGSYPVAALMWSDDCDPQNSKKNGRLYGA